MGTQTGDESEIATSGHRSKLALFLPNLAVGGAQRVAITIANGLADRGHEVHVVVPFETTTHTTDHAEGDRLLGDIDDAVRLVELGAPVTTALGVLTAIPALRRYLVTERPEVLFAHQTHTNLVAVLAELLARTATHVAVTEHTAYESGGGLRDRVAKAIVRHGYRFADGVVAVSEGVADSLGAGTAVDREAVTVLYNPIDVDAIRRASGPVDHEWFTDGTLRPIVTAGRLEPVKDVPTLLRAFAHVHESHPETRLLVAGDGSERDRLERLAVELGVADVVDFPGYVDPYPFFHHAEAFVLASRREGLPTVLIEALACGCPVVSTDCAYGPNEILADGSVGELVPVGDERAMAGAIGRTLADPPDPEVCRSRADHFSVAAGIDRYEAYIDGIRSGEGRRPDR